MMGESGCGKNTLVKLLLGYYTGFTGSIQCGDDNVSALDAFALNEMVSIIQQNVYMFDESVRYNICLQQDYPKERLVEAIENSGCLKIFTEDLSLTTKAGENGANLSGGQRQRIAIARALIRNMPILVLDEGTSAVDMHSGRIVEQGSFTELMAAKGAFYDFYTIID